MHGIKAHQDLTVTMVNLLYITTLLQRNYLNAVVHTSAYAGLTKTKWY